MAIINPDRPFNPEELKQPFPEPEDFDLAYELINLKSLVRHYLSFGSTDGATVRQELRKKLKKYV